MKDRRELLLYGQQLLLAWCLKNRVEPPEIKAWYTDPDVDACAYYRDKVISIWPNECARIGVSARQWSYPGYVVDRTPYGVLQHELGHHVDEAYQYRGGLISSPLRAQTREEAITGYCGNDMEWFAELFRLFVTNPDLLKWMRPKTFDYMIQRWPERAEGRPWREVLAGAERWIIAAENKIEKATRPTGALQERLWLQ